jgi:hypothetical protein
VLTSFGKSGTSLTLDTCKILSRLCSKPLKKRPRPCNVDVCRCCVGWHSGKPFARSDSFACLQERPTLVFICGQAPAVVEQLAIVPVRGQDHSSGGSPHLDCACTPARVCLGAGHQQPPPTRREPRHRRRQPHRGRPNSTNRPVVSHWGTRIGCPGALGAGSFSPPTTPAGLPDQLPAFHIPSSHECHGDLAATPLLPCVPLPAGTLDEKERDDGGKNQ